MKNYTIAYKIQMVNSAECKITRTITQVASPARPVSPAPVRTPGLLGPLIDFFRDEVSAIQQEAVTEPDITYLYSFGSSLIWRHDERYSETHHVGRRGIVGAQELIRTVIIQEAYRIIKKRREEQFVKANAPIVIPPWQKP